MKRITIFTILAFTLFQVSCSKDDDPVPPDPNITFRATLSGASEAPTPNSTTGTGTSTLVFNDNTKMFTVTTTYTGLTGAATNGHIHRGAVGVAGPPVFPFTTFTSPVTYSSIALDATQEADLKAGLYYVNIHTSAYTAGEIRGQLVRQ